MVCCLAPFCSCHSRNPLMEDPKNSPQPTEDPPLSPSPLPDTGSPLPSARWRERLRTLLVGQAKDPLAPGVFHRLSLAAFLAWVGLGADGLSSSCYGPEEAFRALGSHTF